MTMRKKIISGFGIIVVLLLIMGIVAMVQFKAASGGFNNYEDLAKEINLSDRIETNMLLSRMSVINFLYKGDDAYNSKFHDYLKTVHEYLDTAQINIEQIDQAKIVDSVEKGIAEYESYYEEVYDLINQRNVIVKTYLDVQGTIMEDALTNILISAEEDNDITASYYASLGMKHLLLGQLHMAKFMDNNDLSHATGVLDELRLMESELVILDTELDSPIRRQYLKNVISSKKIYLDQFKLLVEIINKRNKITDDKLNIIGPQISSWVGEVIFSITRDQDALGAVLESSNARANIVILVILLLATIAGIVIATTTIISVFKQLGADPAELEGIAEKIAKGDLKIDHQIDESLARGVFLSMIKMRKKLTEIVDITITGTEQIASASGQLSTGNQDLSNRTEQQGMALQETSSAIQEMNSSIRSNADNTAAANQLSSWRSLRPGADTLNHCSSWCTAPPLYPTKYWDRYARRIRRDYRL